jgi:hypothetical protein
MRRRLVALGLLAPFVLVALLADRIADRQAASAVEALCQVSDALTRIDPDLDERDQEQVAVWRAELGTLLDESVSEPADASAGGSTSRS